MESAASSIYCLSCCSQVKLRGRATDSRSCEKERGGEREWGSGINTCGKDSAKEASRVALLTSSMLVVFLVAAAPPAFAGPDVYPRGDHGHRHDRCGELGDHRHQYRLPNPDTILFDNDTTLAEAAQCDLAATV
jgi:hypothetical protein